MYRKRSFCAFLGPLMVAAGLYAQPSLTSTDYQRAERFLDIRGMVDNLYIQPHWLEDSTGMWYVVVTDGKKEYRRIDFPDLEPTPAFDHQRLAGVLEQTYGLEVHADSLPLKPLWNYKD